MPRTTPLVSSATAASLAEAVALGKDASVQAAETETQTDPRGRSLSFMAVVASAAVVSLVLGVMIGFGLGRMSDRSGAAPTADAQSRVDASPAPSTSTEQAEPFARYLTWTVSEYIVDGARECSFSEGYLSVVVSITNVSDRTIIAGDAGVSITDLFDEELMRLDTPIDRRLKPGQTVAIGSTGSSCYSLNTFDADEARLAEMENAKSTTRVVFAVTKLAFADGKRLEF